MKVLILAQNLIDAWLDGFEALTDDRISFYTFFTVILAECAYLWGFHEASVAIPIAVHQKCSETYGGRNNRKVETESGEMITKKELDARDLEAAVNANWDANAECLKNEYGMSNEKIEEIRAKLHKLNRNVGLY